MPVEDNGQNESASRESMSSQTADAIVTSADRPPSRFRILIADADSPWRDEIARALAEEGHTVTPQTDPDRLVEALCGAPEDSAWDVALVGEQIGEVSGVDVIYRVWRQRVTREEIDPESLLPRLLLITNVREDSEFLELMRRRGVVGFLDRQDRLAESVARFSRVGFASQRLHPRYSTKRKARIVAGDEHVSAVLIDLSLSGAQIVLAGKEVPPSMHLGTSVRLSFACASDGSEIVCTARVCRHRVRRGLYRQRPAVGLQFVDLDAAARAKIENMIAFLRNVQIVRQTHVFPRIF